jgi:hypothetical protein
MSSDQEMRAVIERIESLVADFSSSPDPTIARNAQELAQLLMRLYGSGLTRILAVLERREGPAGATLAALLGDDLIASLLVLHDLHPEDVETRIGRALERLEADTGASITLVDVQDGVAQVKMVGGRPGTAPLDFQRLIDGVVHAVAPDVVDVEVEGLPPKHTPALVQLGRGVPADRPASMPAP